MLFSSFDAISHFEIIIKDGTFPWLQLVKYLSSKKVEKLGSFADTITPAISIFATLGRIIKFFLGDMSNIWLLSSKDTISPMMILPFLISRFFLLGAIILLPSLRCT